MGRFHIVRVGAMGYVGRFRAADALRYSRSQRVIVRTARGLEIGEVLAPPGESAAGTNGHAGEPDGTLLRRMTAEDELLEARLLKNRDEALAACGRRLEELGLPAVLLDVEHLFDGQSLVFYFLGEVPAEVDGLTAELAETYEANVQFRQFTETLSHGCGPGCGTDQATGNGCGSCGSGCAVAAACGSRLS